MNTALDNLDTRNDLFIRTLSYTENTSILTFSSNHILPDKTICYGSSTDQVIDVYKGRSTNRPLIVVVHGGYYKPEIDRKYLYLLSHTLSKHHKWQVALIEYRRIYKKPKIYTSDILHAIECARRRTKNHNNQIILIGHSVGGHFALWANNMNNNIRDVAGTIALAPVTDMIGGSILGIGMQAIKNFLGNKIPFDKILQLNPINLSYDMTPIIVIHGDLDLRVPLIQSVEFVKKLLNDGRNVRYIEVKNMGHFEIVDPRECVFNIIINELKQFI